MDLLLLIFDFGHGRIKIIVKYALFLFVIFYCDHLLFYY